MTESHSIAESTDRFVITNINRVRRHTERAHYDRASVFGILDRATVAHVAFVMDGRPMVIPMAYGRDGERIYLHGARKSRITTAPAGEPVCISVTLVDGFVVARSAFDSSMNYRAVVIHGRATEVEDDAERLRALECITEQLVPGRWSELRGPTAQELKATAVLVVEIETASAKVREGGVIDSPENDQRVWAGVVPVVSVLGGPLTDASVPADVPVPASVRRMCSSA
ncbi:MAG TPA: pyridoxamine 5'-phosphate oxidase family protein [Gemmatimonadaceae bacterium]|nr:pyridoxamine 5'-phosphate oxidase family protein [Gemmatimonadaceae bacterium]